MPVAMKRYKRKVFVSQRIQALFALYLILSFVLVIFFVGAEFFLSISDLLGIEVTENRFAFLQTSVVQKAVLLVGWGLLCYATAVLIEQNKMAGPLVNFKRTLKNILAGDYTARIRLREKDYFKELASGINDVVGSFQVSVEKDAARIDELLDRVQAAKDECGRGGCPEDVKKALGEIERLLNNFKACKNMHGVPEKDAGARDSRG